MDMLIFIMNTVLVYYLRFQCSLSSDTTTVTTKGHEGHGSCPVETPKATCVVIWDDESSELEWLGWEEIMKCDQEECYPFLDIPTVMSWWQEAEHTAWLDAKHLGSKPSRRVTQIKAKLTADSSHAYYVHPDGHGDADITINSQIPLLSVPDVWCYINPRVMFWTEHLLAYADVQKKKILKPWIISSACSWCFYSALLREAGESFFLASKGF